MVVQPNEPDQPNPNLTWILTLMAKPTQLNPKLIPEDPTRSKNRLSRVQIGYIIGLNPNLNPFLGQLDLIGLVFGSWGLTRPVCIQKLSLKLGWTQKNGSGLAPLVHGWVFRSLGCRVLELSGRFQTVRPPDLTHVDDVPVKFFFLKTYYSTSILKRED